MCLVFIFFVCNCCFGMKLVRDYFWVSINSENVCLLQQIATMKQRTFGTYFFLFFYVKLFEYFLIWVCWLECRLLQNNNISGKIPPELGNLPKLQTLDLSNNRFSGFIPSSLNQLNSLQYMWVFTVSMFCSTSFCASNLHR